MANIFKRLFNKEPDLTEQEKLILGIVTKLVDLPNTNKVLYNGDCSYLSNIDLDIYAAVDGEKIIIVNGEECLSINCKYKFLCMLFSTLDKSVCRNVNDLRGKLEKHQMDKLSAVSDKLSETSREETDKMVGEMMLEHLHDLDG